jgi:hypothetical protein
LLHIYVDKKSGAITDHLSLALRQVIWHKADPAWAGPRRA